MRQQIRSRRPMKAPTGAFPPNKSAGLSARSCVTFQVHEAILWAIFAPAGHRFSVFLRRRAPADLSIACPLSCYCSMGHVAAMLQAVRKRMVTGLRTPGIASPLQEPYLTRPNKDSIVLRLRLKCIRVWWGVFTDRVPSNRRLQSPPGRANVFFRLQAPADLSIACPLSC